MKNKTNHNRTLKRLIKKQGKEIAKFKGLSYYNDIKYRQAAYQQEYDLKLESYKEWLDNRVGEEIPLDRKKKLYYFHTIRQQAKILKHISNEILK